MSTRSVKHNIFIRFFNKIKNYIKRKEQERRDIESARTFLRENRIWLLVISKPQLNKLSDLLDVYKSRGYVYSRKYKKKFLIQHRGMMMRSFEKDGNLDQSIEYLTKQKADKYNAKHLKFSSVVMWVSTDKYNTDIGEPENEGKNIPIDYKCLFYDSDWITLSQHKKEVREERLKKLLEK